jgi:heterodisulfide reductase subunit A
MKAKVGIYICECGPNISERVDIPRISEELLSSGRYDDVELVVKNYGLLCSGDGKTFIEEEIKENGFTHLVIAACSPRDHNKTFINVCKQTDLNPYLYKLVNIREHCAWIIPDKDEATEKAIKYIHGGIKRVLYQSQLLEKQLDITPDVLVLGGGISGLEAALSLAGEKRKVYLVEKSQELGGVSAGFSRLLPRQGGDPAKILSRREEAENNENIRIFRNSELKRVVGFLGNFEVVVDSSSEGNPVELVVGAIIVATGFRLTDLRELAGFDYSDGDEVYSALEVERMVTGSGRVSMKSGEEPKSVALVHCAGRIEKGYCSRICCNYMMKIAGYIKGQSDAIEVAEYFKDLCLPHKEDQKFMKSIAEAGVDFRRFASLGIEGTTVVSKGLDGEESKQEFDMVIVATAMEPAEGTEALAELLELPLHETGFFQEAHQTINPVGTTTDGMFVIGAAQGPRGMTSSILFAQASAGKIATQLIPGQKITPEVKVSEILEAYCTGCMTCLEVCAYGAIYFDDERAISVVNEAICRGCGNCFGSCPSGALRTRHFTNTQLMKEVAEAVRQS